MKILYTLIIFLLSVSLSYGAGCDVNSTGTYIDMESKSSTTVTGTGTFSEIGDWLCSGTVTSSCAIGTGWIKSAQSGTVNSVCPTADAVYNFSVYFGTTGTYKIWPRVWGYSASQDAILFGIDSSCKGNLRADTYNQWSWTNSYDTGTGSFTIDSVGTYVINIGLSDDAIAIDGFYITKGVETPTDTTYDDNLILDPSTCSGSTGTATLTWVAPTLNVDETDLVDLAGYYVYYDTNSSVDTNDSKVDVGNVTTYALTLNLGSTYYFAVSAYDTSSNESTLSNEVSKVMALPDAQQTSAFSGSFNMN